MKKGHSVANCIVTDVGIGSVLVKDASEASGWYEEKLGFETLSKSGHYVTVRPKNGNVILYLCQRCEAWESDSPESNAGIWLESWTSEIFHGEETGALIPGSSREMVEQTYASVKSNGVEFVKERSDSPFGIFAIFKDSDGNKFYIW